jgi:hypothetical protein
MIPDLQEDLKRQEDMDERLSGGRLNAYLPTPFEDGMHMRPPTGCRYSGSPSTSEFGFEGSRTSTKAFGYSCYPDSDTESTHLEENSVIDFDPSKTRKCLQTISSKKCYVTEDVVRMGIICNSNQREKYHVGK